jgi:excisionase family DNA binding protein
MPNTKKDAHQLLTASQAAKVLGVTVGTLEVWRNIGRRGLRHVRIGNRVYYRRTDLEKFHRSQ